MPFPLVQELPYQDPCELFSHFYEREGALFLDTAARRAACGRYSFIAFEPFKEVSSKNGRLRDDEQVFAANPFEHLKNGIKAYPLQTLPELPPFQGGVAGYWGYELFQHLEKLPFAAEDELQFQDLCLGFYDRVLAFDLEEKRAWIFSSGYPEQDEQQRQERARERLHDLVEQLKQLQKPRPVEEPSMAGIKLTQNFSRGDYEGQVQKVIDYILAGDIFEANLSLCFRADLSPEVSPFALYQRLRKINPAPFAAYLHFKDTVLLSASPERFLKLSAGEVETRPIKGTARRAQDPEEDQRLGQALLASDKDRAENVMIVDLLRNDLSRVCEPFSVQVPTLCGLESYATVHHLVSVITGRLQKNLGAIDLLQATFPGGSITGAPKLRAMEIIAELEPTQRGPYCGAIAYLGFDGSLDSAITIRTLCLRGQKLSFQAGGAVVADSSPAQEYEEVLTKAKALCQALGG